MNRCLTMRKLQIISAISLICIFSVFHTGSFASEDSEGWTSLGKDVFINTKSMTYTCGSTISLWVKIIPNEGSDIMFEARDQLMKKGRDDKALAYMYSGLLTEIDCSNNSHRQLITILYDANKNILNKTEHLQASWKATSSGGSFDLVQKAVCEKPLPYASGKKDVARAGG